MPFAYGRWERLQPSDLYIVHPDGSGLKRIGEHGHFCGRPEVEVGQPPPDRVLHDV